jgi:hypothetical protein
MLDLPTRLYLSFILGLLVHSVLSGSAIVAVLSIPELAMDSGMLVPEVIFASFLVSPFAGWLLVPIFLEPQRQLRPARQRLDRKP